MNEKENEWTIWINGAINEMNKGINQQMNKWNIEWKIERIYYWEHEWMN